MFRRGDCVVALCALVGVGAAVVHEVHAQAMRDTSGFQLQTLPRNDDQFSSATPLGFTANFFGRTSNSLFVNNNGNVTFGSGLSDFTPAALNTLPYQIIAPFWSDVDTRPSNGGTVVYGSGTVNGRRAFIANWDAVGYFPNGTDRLNTFQVVLIDRSDVGAGNFDIELNYQQIQWDLGGARAGFANGSQQAGTFYEVPGSGVSGAFLDANTATALIRQTNSGTPGRYLFQVRDGQIILVEVVPVDPRQVSAAQQAEAIAESAPAEVRATVRTIATTIGNRLRELRSGPQGGGYRAANATGDNSAQLALNGMSGGDLTNAIGLWVDATYTNLRNTGTQRFDGHTNTLFVGADYALTDKLVVGGAVGFESGRISTETSNTLRRSRGGMASVYAGYLVTDWLQASVQASLSRAGNDIKRTTIGSVAKGDTPSNRYVLGTALTAFQNFGDFDLSATLGYNRAGERFDSYVSSDGARVGAVRTTLGQVQLGGEAAYNMEKGQVFVSATWEWDHIHSAGTDPNGAVLGAGVRLNLMDNLKLSFLGTAQVLREDDRQYSIGANLRYSF